MSFDVHWDINKYRDDHESDEHWQLRRKFIERWKQDYPEERLICLARVFANMEFLGCRYPTEVMQEVSRLSHEIVQSYRSIKKTKLQRTFVSASDAAEDRAKGNKREGGILKNETPKKLAKISFVRPENKEAIDISITDSEDAIPDSAKETVDTPEERKIETQKEKKNFLTEYLNEMNSVKCLDIRLFNDSMFYTNFGKMVLLMRPWCGKLWNIQASCRACNIQLEGSYLNGCFCIKLDGKLLASVTGSSRLDAKSIAEVMAWNKLKQETVTVVVKELWISQGAHISVKDVDGSNKAEDQFGIPVENTVATKMMKMMGWKGGGLGADAQGIEEPVRPNMQMVNRSGLGSTSDPRHLKKAARSLMQRYMNSDTLDLDLVFSSEFSKEERAALHQVAQQAGLSSKSYGDKDRFLVVKKKMDPFSLVNAVIAKGGCTPKYQVFLPAALGRTNN